MLTALKHQFPFIADLSAGALGAAADLNGDGKLDLVGYSYDHGSWDAIVMLGNGDGSFGTPTTVPGVGPGFVTGLAVADLNGDKKPDLIVIAGGAFGSQGSTYVFLGNGDGTFAAPVPYFAGISDGNVVSADFNKDGKMDVAVGTSNGIAVLWGNGDGTSQPATFLSTALASNYSRWLLTADLNKDGDADLVASGTSAFQAFLGKGDGSFTALTSVNDTRNGPSQTADFNGDGKVDLLVAPRAKRDARKSGALCVTLRLMRVGPSNRLAGVGLKSPSAAAF
jgi:hypothetical protein